MDLVRPPGTPAKIRPEVEYYKHQLEGIRWMQRRNSCILADDMGLGKTIQMLTVLAFEHKAGKRKFLIVTESGLVINMYREVKEFTTFSVAPFRPVGLGGTPKRRADALKSFVEGDVEILVVGYEALYSVLAELLRIEIDIIVYDEFHAIKTPGSRRTATSMVLPAKRHLFMSGSPMESQPGELWPAMRLIFGQDEVPSYAAWCNRFCVYGTKDGSKTTRVIDVKDRAALAELTDKVMLRRMKRDCLDLPEKIRTKVVVAMTPSQQKVIADIKSGLSPFIAGLRGNEMMIANQKALRMRQAIVTPAILGLDDDSGKLDAIQDLVKNLHSSGEKTLLFTQHVGAVKAMTARLTKLGIPNWGIWGEVNNRVQMTDDWRVSDGGALVVTRRTMGAGQNLTESHNVIIMDKNYMPTKEDQAEDRTDRIGQKHQVNVWEFIAEGTYEDTIESVLRMRRKMIDGTIPNSGITVDVMYRAIYAPETLGLGL